MTREEILAKFENFSDEELNAILEEKASVVSKELISHENLNEEFGIFHYRGDKSYLAKSFEYFEKNLRKILAKVPYGVLTYLGYDKFQRTLPYGHTTDEAVAFIKGIFADITKDASFGVARSIDLFNSRNEIIWTVSYENDVIRNLEDFYIKSMGTKSELAKLLKEAREFGVDEDTINEISRGLLYISDFLYFKDGSDKNEWENKIAEEAEERRKFFRSLKLRLLFYGIDEDKGGYPLKDLFDILFKSYRY